MKKNNVLGTLVISTLLLFASCSKDNNETGPEPFNPGINDLPAEMQEWVRMYPGEVSGDITRLNDVEVAISGKYDIQAKEITRVMPLYWQSSGLYVPPAEEITVDVPTGVTGLKYQIGVAQIELVSSEQKARYHQVTQNGKLNPGLNTLKTTFGGPLYFYFEGTPSGDATVKVSGAIKSNDFVSGKTSPTEWRQEIDLSPWSELIGKRVIFTLPASTLKKIEDPQAFLDFYDDFIEKDIEKLQGMESGQIAMPWRIYADVQLPAEGSQNPPILRTSYPVAFVTNQMEETVIGLPQFKGNQMAEWLRGIANLYNTGTYSKEMKPLAEDRFAWHLMQRKSQWANIGFEMTQPKKVGERYWMARESSRSSMYLQLLQEYGWGMVVYTKMRNQEEIKGYVPDQYANDLLAMYASEYANTDLTDFFGDWDFPVSMYARQYMKHYPAPAERFWKIADNSKQPDQTSETPAGIAYEKIIPANDTIYAERTNWKITAGSVSADGYGAVANLLDGKLDTYYQSGENSKYPHWIACLFKDNSGEPTEVEFNYLQLVQRTFVTPGPKSFQLLIKPSPMENEDDWVEVEDGKTFYLLRDFDPVQNIYQTRHTSQSYKAFGIKLVFTAPLPGHEGGSDTINSMTLSELELGLLK